MKALMTAALLTLLAGCAGMGSYDKTSGTAGSQSGASGQDPYQTDDVFHSWVD